jgi:hypothetical protein
MSKANGRQRCFIAIVVGSACLGFAHPVHASDQSTQVALEQRLQEEFAKVGIAVRERLAREAAGDFLGARVAAHDADTHRYWFLDIKRELARRSPLLASPSVAVSRSPFAPDFATLPMPDTAAARQGLAAPNGNPTETAEPKHPSWDMYRPRALEVTATVDEWAGQNPTSGAGRLKAFAGRGGDMYRNPSMQSPHGGESGPGPDKSWALSVRESPSKPFFVYRERFAPTHGAD